MSFPALHSTRGNRDYSLVQIETVPDAHQRRYAGALVGVVPSVALGCHTIYVEKIVVMLEHVSPLKFQSIQDFLFALGFEIKGDFFVRDDVKFTIAEIISHTPTTFFEKAKHRGWLERSTPSLFRYAPWFSMD